jgi:ATP-dependent Clp protease ATP-binding subunit ClpC
VLPQRRRVAEHPLRPADLGDTLGPVFERFTDRARRVLTFAQEEARLLNHSFIGTEHILLGLIREGDGVGAQALRSLGVSLEVVRVRVVEVVGTSGSAPTGSPPFTPRAKKVLELALREALQLNHSYIGTEHILLGLVREGEGVAAKVLVDVGVDLLRVRQAVNTLMTTGAASLGVQRIEGTAETGAPHKPPKDPSCPGCTALLAVSARFRTLSVPTDADGTSAPMPLHVVYCEQCGTTLHMSKVDDPTST